MLQFKRIFLTWNALIMIALSLPDLAQRTTTLAISNKRMKDIMEIDKSLEESSLLNSSG